jgi:hypothetical protein
VDSVLPRFRHILIASIVLIFACFAVYAQDSGQASSQAGADQQNGKAAKKKDSQPLDQAGQDKEDPLKRARKADELSPTKRFRRSKS